MLKQNIITNDKEFLALTPFHYQLEYRRGLVWKPEQLFQFTDQQANELYEKNGLSLKITQRSIDFFTQGRKPSQCKPPASENGCGQGFGYNGILATDNKSLVIVFDLMPAWNEGSGVPETTASGGHFIHRNRKFGVKAPKRGTTTPVHVASAKQWIEAAKEEKTSAESFYLQGLSRIGGGLWTGEEDLISEFTGRSASQNEVSITFNPLFLFCYCNEKYGEGDKSCFWITRELPSEINELVRGFFLNVLPVKNCDYELSLKKDSLFKPRKLYLENINGKVAYSMLIPGTPNRYVKEVVTNIDAPKDFNLLTLGALKNKILKFAFDAKHIQNDQNRKVTKEINKESVIKSMEGWKKMTEKERLKLIHQRLFFFAKRDKHVEDFGLKEFIICCRQQSVPINLGIRKISDGNTIFHEMILSKNTNYEDAEYLLGIFPDLTIRNKKGMTVLDCFHEKKVINNDDRYLINQMLGKGLKFSESVTLEPTLLNTLLRDETQSKILTRQDQLIAACRQGNVSEFKSSLKLGAKLIVDIQDEQPLGAAVWGMCPEIVNLLLRGTNRVASMTWEECKIHNEEYYNNELFIVSEFNPNTYGEWNKLLQKINSNLFLTQIHLAQIQYQQCFDSHNISSWDNFKSFIAELAKDEGLKISTKAMDAISATQMEFIKLRRNIRNAIENAKYPEMGNRYSDKHQKPIQKESKSDNTQKSQVSQSLSQTLIYSSSPNSQNTTNELSASRVAAI